MKKILLVAGIAAALGGMSTSTWAADNVDLAVSATSLNPIDLTASSSVTMPRMSTGGSVVMNCDGSSTTPASYTGTRYGTGVCGIVTASATGTFSVTTTIGNAGTGEVTLTGTAGGCKYTGGVSTGIPAGFPRTLYCGAEVTSSNTAGTTQGAYLHVVATYD